MAAKKKTAAKKRTAEPTAMKAEPKPKAPKAATKAKASSNGESKTAPAMAKKATVNKTADTVTTFTHATRSSSPPPPSAPPTIKVLPDTPSMLSLSALLDDDQSTAVWEKRWGAVVLVARANRPATGDEVAAVVAWGRSLGRISEETLDRHLPLAASGVQLGNAFIALLRAGAAREVISVSRQFIDACTERQYKGAFATTFVSQVFAAATFVDGDIRGEVLEWALHLSCPPDPTVFFNRACALALSGHTEGALDNVRLARKHGVPAHVFRQDSDFARIAKHPDFEQALRVDGSRVG